MAKKKAPRTKRAATTDEYGRRILTPEHQARRHTDGPAETVEPATQSDNQTAPESED